MPARDSVRDNLCVLISGRLRALREQKKLCQADIEKRTGLLPPYISRIENGHTVPSVETLEKLARALEVPLYQLFYDGEGPPAVSNSPRRKATSEIQWGTSGKEARMLRKLRRLLGRMEARDRGLLLQLTQKMAARRHAD